MIRAPFILAKAGGSTAALMLQGWRGTKLSTCIQWIPTTPAKRTLSARRMLAAANGMPIPMNKVEAKRFRLMVMNNMHLDFQQARIDACRESTTVLRKIDLIQAFANAAVCESYNGEAQS
jgi:hypothetical protein